MKIGIDASRLKAGMTGVGRYTEGILAPLDRELPDATFVLYARRQCSVVLPSSRWSVRSDLHPILSRLPTPQWIHYRLMSMAKSDGLDVFWAANTLVPRGLEASAPCVTTVHDLIHLFVPETLPPLTRLGYGRWFDADVRRADKVVVISQGTAERLRDRLGRHADGIAYPAVPVLPLDRGTAAETLSKLGVRRPFLLTVGTRAPRKNLVSVVAAVKLLKARGQLLDYQLVMAGGEAWNRSNRSVEQDNGSDWIKPLGHVSDEMLAALYSHAEAFLFPSLYEGYGMPVIEARALGCRVITSDSPELREAGGATTTYVAPTPQGIAAGLELALAKPAPVPVKLDHDWDDAGKVMARLFREAASSR
ncbi:glycosyltransferase family 1 protein [Rhodanobacter sp. MP1X3]|uniref:glycosyltransferase family 4 protein n=1 Tax=Rhodanobacter sp. MP1X3 TaxID=2723086 RepID=UPI001612C20F|nr:glycosyltransferase family 1 protein [Rhodanobacter sp. MP1X3]MBB6242324.1 glycosyltransferase involved in cell wall biosynthesis [Rhodanobacter sp. MP1X3]